MSDPSKILLVDDDPVFVEATKTVLETRYKVAVAYDGDSGLAAARKEKPDLILLDIIMPTKDGFHVCKLIKEDPGLAAIPVVVLTSFSQQRGQTGIPVSAGMDLEAEGYISKPVSPEALLKQVASFLKKK
jgi:CheY-like chemotaxis protein